MIANLKEEFGAAVRDFDAAATSLDEAKRRLEIVADQMIRETGPSLIEADEPDEVRAMEEVKDLQGQLTTHANRAKAVSKAAGDGQKQADKVSFAVRRLYKGIVERGEAEQRRRQKEEEERQQGLPFSGPFAGAMDLRIRTQDDSPVGQVLKRRQVEVPADLVSEAQKMQRAHGAGGAWKDAAPELADEYRNLLIGILEKYPEPVEIVARIEPETQAKVNEVLGAKVLEEVPEQVRNQVQQELADGPLKGADLRAKSNATDKQVKAMCALGLLVKDGKVYRLPDVT